MRCKLIELGGAIPEGAEGIYNRMLPSGLTPDLTGAGLLVLCYRLK